MSVEHPEPDPQVPATSDPNTPGPYALDPDALDPDALARATLSRARQLAGRYQSPRRRRPQTLADQRTARDPQLFGEAMEGILAARGWDSTIRDANVVAQWPQIAGQDIAEHCKVISLQDSVLTLQADSTTWAQQLRLLTATLMVRISEKVGDDVVKDIRIMAPQAPSWRKGQWRVNGRGPRDTYG